MELVFKYYLILAISGGLMSVLVHYLPIVSRLEFLEKNEHQFVQSKLLSGIVWFIMATIAIPFIAKALLLDEAKENFINKSLKAASED